MKISIRSTDSPRAIPAINDVQFGSHASDHIFVAEYNNESEWHSARIVPFSDFHLDPRALVLHYGQSVFEGLKAYRQEGGNIALFRPEKNAERLNASCARMGMPRLPPALFLDGLQQLVKLEIDWIPSSLGAALYARPIMFANEPILGVRRASSYIFCIMMCPVPPYYRPGDAPLKLLAREDVARTTRGGCGDAKTSANYGQTIVPLEEARRQGYDNLLWLDAERHQLIEEAGITNVFVRYADGVATPPLSGRILPGVTRASVIQLLHHQSIEVKEREIGIEELMADIEHHRVQEMFLTGTATVVAPVEEVGFRGRRFKISTSPVSSRLSDHLYRSLTDIQYGRSPDHFGWMRSVSI